MTSMPESLEAVDLAKSVREQHFGSSLALHSVIYPIDFCTSGCTYCGLSQLLAAAKSPGARGGMPPADFDWLVKELGRRGYTTHELVFGTVSEDQTKLASRIARWVDRARQADPESYLIVNCDTLLPAGYRQLKDAGADAIWTFMEIMTPDLYRQKHRSGLKSDQEQRLEAPERIRSADLAVGNALLWGLVDDWQTELDRFVSWSREIGGFDFVATPVQQHLTLTNPAQAPAFFDVTPPLLVDTNLYREIVSRLRIAFPDARLVGNTRLDPKFIYGEMSRIVDMCNGYVWTGSRSHPKEALAESGLHMTENAQMDFFNPGASPHEIEKLLPNGFSIDLDASKMPGNSRRLVT